MQRSAAERKEDERVGFILVRGSATLQGAVVPAAQSMPDPLSTDLRDTSARTEAWVAFVCALVGFGLAASMIADTRDFALDDAWIHLSYAKSLRLGDGLSYNPGDAETGFSSPLWVLLLSVWPIAGNPVVPVKLLGALLHAATSWMAALVTLELCRRSAQPQRPVPLASLTVLGGVLVAIQPTLVQAATSGMEVPLATFVLLAACREVLLGRSKAAAAWGLACTGSRPELLGAVVVFAGVIVATRWRARAEDARVRAATFAIIGALAALGIWVLYCLAVSGAPWPNAQYVKGPGGGLAGLAYVRDEVLPWQPWFVGLSGVVLVGLALRADARDRDPATWALLAAFVLTSIAIAVSRPLHPGVLFFESRYFAPLAPLPILLVPVGLRTIGPDAKRWQRWLAAVALVPVGGLSGLQIWQLRGDVVEHCEDTHALHTQVAQWVATSLPPDAVVGVEGAGAQRFFTPRTMRIVDLVGLNDRDAAHAHFERTAKLCVFVRRGLTHLVIPADWAAQFSPPFAVRALTRFDDPRYTQVRPPRPASVVVFEIGGVAPDWAARCR